MEDVSLFSRSWKRETGDWCHGWYRYWWKFQTRGEKFHTSMHAKVNRDVGEEEGRGKEKSEKSQNICGATPLLSQEARADLTADLGQGKFA